MNLFTAYTEDEFHILSLINSYFCHIKADVTNLFNYKYPVLNLLSL